MANWDSYRVSDIIDDIDDNKFVLPVIQRRLVWSEEKIELLFDTLLKGDSFGGIMVIKEEKNSRPLFSFRPFSKDGEPINSIEVDRIEHCQSFVIDGQQRLQSFYIGLSGTINSKILYFDLFSNSNAEFEFKFEREYNKLPKKAKDDSNKKIIQYKWHSARDLLRDLKNTGNPRTTAKNIIQRDEIIDEQQKDVIEENICAFYNNTIGNKCLGISEVILDKTANETINRQRIVELFKRLNDGGTKLSPFDLVASILKGFEWEMERFLEETLEEFKDIGLSQDNLIKLVFLLQDNHAKEMTDISREDANFAINNRERIKNTLESLRKFLKAAELYNYYNEGNRSFVPLFFIAYHIFHKRISHTAIPEFFNNFDCNNPEFIKIKKWMYFSLANGVFRSRGAGWIPYKTGIKKMLDVIKNFKNIDFPIERLFDVYKKHGVTFEINFDIPALDELDSSFIFYLIYDRKQTIRIQDIDHIMPKAILAANGNDWSKINSIRNLQLLDRGTNRGEKNGKPFKEWMKTCVQDQPAFSARHLIPSNNNIWGEDKFDIFIDERAKLILNKIKEYVY